MGRNHNGRGGEKGTSGEREIIKIESKIKGSHPILG
jgi:hypothetical protein